LSAVILRLELNDPNEEVFWLTTIPVPCPVYSTITQFRVSKLDNAIIWMRRKLLPRPALKNLKVELPHSPN
jgi:hypothetical protein